MELLDTLAEYGADRHRIVRLDTPSAGALAYVDLLNQSDRPAAVVTDQMSAPVAYVLDLRDAPNVSAGRIARWRHELALRGQAAHLVVVRPGQLDVYDTGLGAREGELPEVIAEGAPEAPLLFSRLAFPTTEGRAPRSLPDVRGRLFALTTDAIDALRRNRSASLTHALSIGDAISLVGRAVFMRFLLDRNIVSMKDLAETHPAGLLDDELFDGSENAASTCAWIDATFNGDLLPLSFPVEARELEERIDVDGWRSLGNILRRAAGGQFDLSDDWTGLDFSRIPAGVLSQLYEQQAATWAPDQRRETSIYFTPAPIADLMVNSVLAALDPVEGSSRDQAIVLDPAVGGGVFLVSALRELVKIRWERTSRRPGTAEIREIVATQLFGLDINETALRLTALSLYLAALELDPDPQPLASLRFRRLVGTNLVHVGSDEPAGRAGSLGPNSPSEWDRKFDVVVGNPPWTSGKRDAAVAALVTQRVRSVVAEVIPDEAREFALPDNNPDIAFLWRSLLWSREGGRIALVSHARLWLKQSPVGTAARSQLLRAAEWTSVVNCAALRMSGVWPNITAPFVIWFGINRRPAPNRCIFNAVAVPDDGANQRGRFRIDPKSSAPLLVEQILSRPWIPKTLMRGSSLDEALVWRLKHRCGFPSFVDHWDETVGPAYRGQGYKVSPRNSQSSSMHMLNLPNLSTEGAVKRLLSRPRINADELTGFSRTTLHRPRKPAIYSGPLLLVRETPPVRGMSPNCFICDADKVVYTESFYGYSAAVYEGGRELVAYLQLILAGPMLAWFALMTSAKFGVERDSILLEDVERLPIPSFVTLTREQRDQVAVLSCNYQQRPRGFVSSPEYLKWLGSVYALDAEELTVIRDTVAVGAPGTSKYAQGVPSASECHQFVDELVSHLGEMVSKKFEVTEVARVSSSWRILSIGVEKETLNLDFVRGLVLEAEGKGASQVVWVTGGGAVVAVLGQVRYWTRSRARLLARELFARDDFFPGALA